MKLPNPHNNILKENEVYWQHNHEADYQQTRQIFIKLVNQYNEHINDFTSEQKTAFSNIHKAWRSKLYHNSPWELFALTLKDHNFLTETIDNELWKTYYRSMETYHEQNKIREYRLHYEKHIKPTGEPPDYPRGPTGAH